MIDEFIDRYAPWLNNYFVIFTILIFCFGLIGVFLTGGL